MTRSIDGLWSRHPICEMQNDSKVGAMVPLEGRSIAACTEEESTLATGTMALSPCSTKTESSVGQHNGNKAARRRDVWGQRRLVLAWAISPAFDSTGSGCQALSGGQYILHGFYERPHIERFLNSLYRTEVCCNREKVMRSSCTAGHCHDPSFWEVTP